MSSPRSSVHPHVRGDDGLPWVRSRPSFGPPPRAWGRHGAGRRAERRQRSTPTCVGMTTCPAPSATAQAVHPHLRGDDAYRVWSFAGGFGPSPRAWGRRSLVTVQGVSQRSTPTCVGTTDAREPTASVMPVHPHVRGDDATVQTKTSTLNGPRPRAWGRARDTDDHADEERSTPTCVGTTPRGAHVAPGRPVHPHVRGDEATTAESTSERNGPPPRAWGRHDRGAQRPLRPRSTPTCVGTTSAPRSASSVRSVHPHVRGDDWWMRSMSGTISGPPPRAWGRRHHVNRRHIRLRSTPTCVGTTASLVRYSPVRAVHPHVRGDDPNSWYSARTASGPPPRAWGRRVHRHVASPVARSTPTCVGTTRRRWLRRGGGSVHPHVRGDD